MQNYKSFFKNCVNLIETAFGNKMQVSEEREIKDESKTSLHKKETNSHL